MYVHVRPPQQQVESYIGFGGVLRLLYFLFLFPPFIPHLLMLQTCLTMLSIVEKDWEEGGSTVGSSFSSGYQGVGQMSSPARLPGEQPRKQVELV